MSQRQRMYGFLLAGVVLLVLALGTLEMASLQRRAIQAQAQVRDLQEQLRNVHAERLLTEKDEAQCCEKSEAAQARGNHLEIQIKGCQESSVKDHEEARTCKDLHRTCSSELTKVNGEVGTLSAQLDRLTTDYNKTQAVIAEANALLAPPVVKPQASPAGRTSQRGGEGGGQRRSKRAKRQQYEDDEEYEDEEEDDRRYNRQRRYD